MRRLIVRFLRLDEPMPPATRTYKDTIPDAEFLELCRWATRGGELWGRTRTRVEINVLRATSKREDVGHGAAEEIQGSTN